MDKRFLSRAQAWGGVALREIAEKKRNAAWKRGMKLAEKHYRGMYASGTQYHLRQFLRLTDNITA